LHSTMEIPDRMRPEIALVHLGVFMDGGVNANQFTRDFFEKVFAALPRLNSRADLIKNIGAVLQKKPHTAYLAFEKDIALRTIPDYNPSNFVDFQPPALSVCDAARAPAPEHRRLHAREALARRHQGASGGRARLCQGQGGEPERGPHPRPGVARDPASAVSIARWVSMSHPEQRWGVQLEFRLDLQTNRGALAPKEALLVGQRTGPWTGSAGGSGGRRGIWSCSGLASSVPDEFRELAEKQL